VNATLETHSAVTDEGSRELVVFRLDAGEYALPVANVGEVLRMVAITPVPEAPEWLPGVINLRGRVIPVIDLRRKLHLPEAKVGVKAPIIVAEHDGAPVPIVIVQHITVGFHQGLADWLNNVTPLTVKLGVNGEPLRAGEVVIAPGEHHMAIDSVKRVKLTTEPAIGGHRPSVTHMFRSVARVYGKHALGVILTGMGDDGAEGLVQVKRAGGWVIGQDEASCVVYGMPREAAARGAVTEVLPLTDIAGAITQAWSHGRLPVVV